MSRKLVTVVTGANRGIGHAICQTLASDSGSSPLVIYATSRQGVHLDIKPSHKNEIRYAKLDIASTISILDFLSLVLKQGQAIDVLINNAGINLDEDYNFDNATKTFDVNYRATRQVCELFLTEGRMASVEKARIVNVSSGASQLTNYSSSIVSRFRDPSLDLLALDGLASEYLHAVETHNEKGSGWNHVNASYSVSKACLNAYTFILARQNPGVLINCCCPGWVQTDMGRQVGNSGKAPKDGAKIPVRLAVGDIGGVTGRYWANSGVTDTGDGEVK